MFYKCIWFDQRDLHIRSSNDRFIKLQTLGKISLSGLRIIFNFSRESSWLKWGYFVFIKSIKEGLILLSVCKNKVEIVNKAELHKLDVYNFDY